MTKTTSHPTEPPIVSVPVARIRTEMEALFTQVRIEHDAETIENYAEEMGRGETFPPVSLVADGKGRYFIADGWHRVLAAKEAKAKSLAARVLPPLPGLAPLSSAVRYALRSNTSHGLRLSRGDERNKARRAIQEVPGLEATSDRKISREIGVSHQTVSRARNELVRERQIPHSITRELMEDLMPDQYAGVQAFREAFGRYPEVYQEVRDYLRRLRAHHPKDWTYAEGRVTHRGLIPDTAVSFEIEGNPVVDGLPSEWEALDDPDEPPTPPLDEDKRAMIERMNAEREFAGALSRIKARGRNDLTQAALTLQRYRNVPGLYEDLRALVLAGGPPQEHQPSDF